jgi:hypothetical protein
MGALQFLKVTHQLVILRVSDLGRVGNVVKVLMPPERFAEFFYPVSYGFRHCLWKCKLGRIGIYNGKQFGGFGLFRLTRTPFSYSIPTPASSIASVTAFSNVPLTPSTSMVTM